MKYAPIPAPIAAMISNSSFVVAVVIAWGNLSGIARMSLIGEFKCLKATIHVCNELY